MSAADRLLDALRSELGGISHVGYVAGANAYDVFEGYIWARMLGAARGTGWSVAYANPDGAQTDNFLFRTAPGVIHSSTPYTFGVLTHDEWPPLEVHLGIKVKGRSGVSHEFDVVALTQDAAQAARNSGHDPSWRDVVAHAECKFYAVRLPLGLGRAMWGMSADCRLRLKGGLVSNADRTDSIRCLLGHHGVYYRPYLLPGRPAAVQGLDDDLQWRFRRWLESQGFAVPLR